MHGDDQLAMPDPIHAAGWRRADHGDHAAVLAPDIEKRLPALPDRLRQQLHGFGADALRRSIVPLGRMIFGRADALDLLPGIVAPTLVIIGENERARPLEESRTMAEILQTELVTIPGEHAATLGRPEAVNAALLRFLERGGLGHVARSCRRASGAALGGESGACSSTSLPQGR